MPEEEQRAVSEQMLNSSPLYSTNELPIGVAYAPGLAEEWLEEDGAGLKEDKEQKLNQANRFSF